MREGKSFETFGATVNCVKQTLYNWLKEHEEFLDAKRQGDLLSQAWWEQVGRDGLWNTKDGPTLNTSNWIFQMKNRFGWKDRVEVDANTNHTGSITHQHVTLLPKERIKVLKEVQLLLGSGDEDE